MQFHLKYRCRSLASDIRPTELTSKIETYGYLHTYIMQHECKMAQSMLTAINEGPCSKGNAIMCLISAKRQ